MTSLATALRPLVNRDVAVWLNHHDLKVLAARLVEVQDEHIVLKSGDQTYFVPYTAITAVRPAQ